MSLKSSFATPQWPVIPDEAAAKLLALQWQLDVSQWWSPEQLRATQFQQLSTLADHAAKTVPFHAKRLRDAGFRTGRPIDERMWRRLPVLTRAELRDMGEKLHARDVPKNFGDHYIASSSGSTGVPVRVRKSGIDGLMWNSIFLREENWHNDDVSGVHAVIKGFAGVAFPEAEAARLRSPAGLIWPDWGSPANIIWQTGKSGLIHSNVSEKEKVEFLIRLQPQHLSTSPSTLRLLLGYFHDHGLKLPSLRSVRTSTERLDDDLRELCQKIFACPIVHNYSANEVGYMALQCPRTTQYHIQSEVVYCEVLNESGAQCQPGEVGRVVVTPLHNFSMPLLRYEIGDEAEVGPPCSCGRGLPVLRAIVGRTADYLTLRSGLRRRVTYNVYRISRIEGIREYQLVQKDFDRIEIRMAVRRELTPAEIGLIQEVMQAAFGAAFLIELRYVEALPRTAAGKLRPFISEVEPVG